MKQGIEIRPNGSKIIKQGKLYYVLHKIAGKFQRSKNGPWDYLHNARKDADEA